MNEATDRPRIESIEFMQSLLSRHDKVESFEQIDDREFVVERYGKRKIHIYLAYIYTIGYSDVLRINSHRYEVNCIVTSSAWCGYSEEAKAVAIENEIGLFTFKELSGALNFDEFWLYETPEKDDSGKAGKHRRMAS